MPQETLGGEEDQLRALRVRLSEMELRHAIRVEYMDGVLSDITPAVRDLQCWRDRLVGATAVLVFIAGIVAGLYKLKN